MANKLWEKNFEVNREIERFTVGRDREMDLYLAKYDVLGSMAHITMLESIGLLKCDELPSLLAELKRIYAIAERGEFCIEDGVANALAECEEKGIRLIDKAPRLGAEKLQIAFLHPKSTCGVLTELCEH